MSILLLFWALFTFKNKTSRCSIICQSALSLPCPQVFRRTTVGNPWWVWFHHKERHLIKCFLVDKCLITWPCLFPLGRSLPKEPSKAATPLDSQSPDHVGHQPWQGPLSFWQSFHTHWLTTSSPHKDRVTCTSRALFHVQPSRTSQQDQTWA